MKREIKFRAKDDKGNWVYGSYLKEYFSTRYGQINAICYNDNFRTNRIPIDVKTLGQFTGITDKNGKEIYEGDILARFGNHYIVAYEGIGYRMIWTKEDTVNRYPDEKCEVIGNIHENPELLKQTNSPS